MITKADIYNTVIQRILPYSLRHVYVYIYIYINMHQWNGYSLIQAMFCCYLFGGKPLPGKMLNWCQFKIVFYELNSINIDKRQTNIFMIKCKWRCHLLEGGHFIEASVYHKSIPYFLWLGVRVSISMLALFHWPSWQIWSKELRNYNIRLIKKDNIDDVTRVIWNTLTPITIANGHWLSNHCFFLSIQSL